MAKSLWHRKLNIKNQKAKLPQLDNASLSYGASIKKLKLNMDYCMRRNDIGWDCRARLCLVRNDGGALFGFEIEYGEVAVVFSGGLEAVWIQIIF